MQQSRRKIDQTGVSLDCSDPQLILSRPRTADGFLRGVFSVSFSLGNLIFFYFSCWCDKNTNPWKVHMVARAANRSANVIVKLHVLVFTSIGEKSKLFFLVVRTEAIFGRVSAPICVECLNVPSAWRIFEQRRGCHSFILRIRSHDLSTSAKYFFCLINPHTSRDALVLKIKSLFHQKCWVSEILLPLGPYWIT